MVWDQDEKWMQKKPNTGKTDKQPGSVRKTTWFSKQVTGTMQVEIRLTGTKKRMALLSQTRPVGGQTRALKEYVKHEYDEK